MQIDLAVVESVHGADRPLTIRSVGRHGDIDDGVLVVVAGRRSLVAVAAAGRRAGRWFGFCK